MMLPTVSELLKKFEGARNSYISEGGIGTIKNPTRQDQVRFLQVLMEDIRDRNAKDNSCESDLIAAFYGALMLIAHETKTGRLHSAVTSVYHDRAKGTDLTVYEKVKCFKALNTLLHALALKENVGFDELNSNNPFTSSGSLTVLRLHEFITLGYNLECKERKHFMSTFPKEGTTTADLAQYNAITESPKVFIASLGNWANENGEVCVKNIPQAIKEAEALKTGKPDIIDWPDTRRRQQVSFLLKLESLLSDWEQGTSDQKSAILLGACLVVAQVISNEGNRNSHTQTEIHKKTLHDSLNPKNKELLVQAFYDFCRFMTIEEEHTPNPKVRTQNPFTLGYSTHDYDMDAFGVLMPVAQDMIRDTRIQAFSVTAPKEAASISYLNSLGTIFWGTGKPTTSSDEDTIAARLQ